jgi:hypothetical protein
MTTTANEAAIPPTIHHFFDDFNASYLSFRVQISWLFCQRTLIIGGGCEELVKELCGYGGDLPAEAAGTCSLAWLVASWGMEVVRGEERVDGAKGVEGRCDQEMARVSSCLRNEQQSRAVDSWMFFSER